MLQEEQISKGQHNLGSENSSKNAHYGIEEHSQSKSQSNQILVLFGVVPLLAFAFYLLLSQPIVNVKVFAAAGIIMYITVMRLIDFKQKK